MNALGIHAFRDFLVQTNQESEAMDITTRSCFHEAYGIQWTGTVSSEPLVLLEKPSVKPRNMAIAADQTGKLGAFPHPRP